MADFTRVRGSGEAAPTEKPDVANVSGKLFPLFIRIARAWRFGKTTLANEHVCAPYGGTKVWVPIHSINPGGHSYSAGRTEHCYVCPDCGIRWRSVE